MVKYLLDHGAETARETTNFSTGYIYETMLDFALDCGNTRVNIIKDMVTPRQNITYVPCWPYITIRTLRLGTLSSDTSILKLLVDRNPAVLDEVRSKPWLLSEAAAVHETGSMLALLQKWGIDITALNASGKVSALDGLLPFECAARTLLRET
jgi:hypothetical protein